MIEIIGLTKAFNGVRAVDDVSAEFPAGSVTALLGLNGAGKTTLLRLIAGLDAADAGSIAVCGQESRRDPRLLGVHLGPDAMDPRHTVSRHLRWLASLAGVSRPRVEEVLAEAGLSDLSGARIGRLSLGMRQRLAIAGTQLCAPRALLFDEPLNGLDVPGIVWFRNLLRRRADDGCSVIVATHLLSEVALTADRIAVLVDGHLHAVGDLQQLTPDGADTREWLETTLLECV